MARPPKERKKYYWVETSTDNAAVISSACETLATLLVGKLDIMETIISNAIERRTGEKPTDTTMQTVKDLLKSLQYIGWDSTYGNMINVHGYSKSSDALFDVSEVLNFQMGRDGIPQYKDCRYPMHWNDDVQLIRIVKSRDNIYDRRKQPATFVGEN